MPELRRPAKRCRRSVLAGLLPALCTLLASCDSSAPEPPAETNPPLAAARVDLAATRLAADAPDEALALLVSALEADPASAEARDMAARTLSKTRWHLPETRIHHPLPIERIHFAPPAEIWVGLAGAIRLPEALNTTVRWNLESLKIESVLFPAPETRTRSLVFDPTHRAVLVERAGLALLCDAQSLKPIRELDPLPDFVTPSATVVFSPNGLLLAHPTLVSETDPSLVWKIRDTGSGEVIRSSEPIPATEPKPLAAFLDHRKLRVLRADGSLMDMPVSPVEAIVSTPPAEEIDLTHAQFSDDGLSALTLRTDGPHRDPRLFLMPLGRGDHRSLDSMSLLNRFPWSRHPGIWTDLLRDRRFPLLGADNHVHFSHGNLAPIHTATDITAIATGGDRIVTGERRGFLTIHRLLPQPLVALNPPKPATFDAPALAALRDLSRILAGVTYNDTHRSYLRSPIDERLTAFKTCDFGALARVFPSLDFSPLIAVLHDFKPISPPPDALDLLTERLARATATAEHPELVTAFDQMDDKAVRTAIKSAGPKGAAAAKALELTLASTHPEWIDACLQQAKDLPPMLRQIALSRIAWLQDRKADAIAGWPDVFPDLKQVRLREDWDGWEAVDYSQALEKLRLGVSEELAALVVPENPTPGQRQAVIARLSDPLTLKAVGRARFASACLKAALALSPFKDDSETTLKLAATARQLGEAAAPCLRAEAMSLTALGDYPKARDRWVALITEHPVEDQVPGDYAEAAYTSFENADPRQAMAILTTGFHRFPNDANFALRAGWVALLTGNAQSAYRFLLAGRQIGYPPEKLENATALLAAAAMQCGAAEDAAAFYQDLIRLDPAWEQAETIENLTWPDELKAALRQLVW